MKNRFTRSIVAAVIAGAMVVSCGTTTTISTFAETIETAGETDGSAKLVRSDIQKVAKSGIFFKDTPAKGNNNHLNIRWKKVRGVKGYEVTGTIVSKSIRNTLGKRSKDWVHADGSTLKNVSNPVTKKLYLGSKNDINVTVRRNSLYKITIRSYKGSSNKKYSDAVERYYYVAANNSRTAEGNARIYRNNLGKNAAANTSVHGNVITVNRDFDYTTVYKATYDWGKGDYVFSNNPTPAIIDFNGHTINFGKRNIKEEDSSWDRVIEGYFVILMDSKGGGGIKDTSGYRDNIFSGRNTIINGGSFKSIAKRGKYRVGSCVEFEGAGQLTINWGYFASYVDTSKDEVTINDGNFTYRTRVGTSINDSGFYNSKIKNVVNHCTVTLPSKINRKKLNLEDAVLKTKFKRDINGIVRFNKDKTKIVVI